MFIGLFLHQAEWKGETETLADFWTEFQNSHQEKPKDHGRFKANVPSEACTKMGVSSWMKGVGGGTTQSSTTLINQQSKG